MKAEAEEEPVTSTATSRPFLSVAARQIHGGCTAETCHLISGLGHGLEQVCFRLRSQLFLQELKLP